MLCSLRCHNTKKLTFHSPIDIKPIRTSRLQEGDFGTADDSVDEHRYLLEDQSVVDKYYFFCLHKVTRFIVFLFRLRPLRS